MHALMTLALVAALALVGAGSAGAVEVQSEKAARDDCSGNSQAEMSACLATKATASRDALNASRENVRAAIGRWYEDAKYIRQATARLDEADKAFEKYRAAECAFNRALGGGAIGNALDMRTLACQVELNTTHADQLDQLASRIRAK
jgi:hypothetical protein